MLDQRLLACASLIRVGSKVCDVGTDHAYLPCYLIKNHITAEVTAVDVNEKPLQRAEKTVASLGLQGQIKLFLSDGLQEVSSDTEDVVIAGMGGELIARILSDCPWAKAEQKHFILQPMTNTPYLRKYLYQNGFAIQKEVPVSENGHFYTVLLCHWTGKEETITELFALIGKVPETAGIEADRYLTYQKERMGRIAAGLLRSQKEKKEIEAETYQKLALQIKTILQDRGAVE